METPADSFEPTGAFGAPSGGDLGDLFRIYEPDIKAAIERISGDSEFFYYASRHGQPSGADEVVLVLGAQTLDLLTACHAATEADDSRDVAWANISWIAHTLAASHSRALKRGKPTEDRVIQALAEQMRQNPIARLPWRLSFCTLSKIDWSDRTVWLYYMWTTPD